MIDWTSIRLFFQTYHPVGYAQSNRRVSGHIIAAYHRLGRTLQFYLPPGLVRKGDYPLLPAALDLSGASGRPLAPTGSRGAVLLAQAAKERVITAAIASASSRF